MKSLRPRRQTSLIQSRHEVREEMVPRVLSELGEEVMRSLVRDIDVRFQVVVVYRNARAKRAAPKSAGGVVFEVVPSVLWADVGVGAVAAGVVRHGFSCLLGGF